MAGDAPQLRDELLEPQINEIYFSEKKDLWPR